MKRNAGLIGFLRFIAICQMLALVAVFVPVRAWLSGWYSWLGLGPAPAVSAILIYVIGATAFFQAAIGIWLWIMLSDVRRYRPMLVATAAVYLIASPTLYFVDWSAGLPTWWRIYDAAWCAIVGIALGLVCRSTALVAAAAPSQSNNEISVARSER